MKPGALLSLMRFGDLRARLALRRDLRAFLELQFLGAALDLGLLGALRSPRSEPDLRRELEIVDLGTFTAFLELGVSLRALSRKADRYSLASRSARALALPKNDSLAASVLELVDYHADSYRHLADYLHTGEKGDYLATRGDLIARSSRIVEPVLAQYVRRSVRAAGAAPRILEVGCGSGVYLLHTARANSRASGIGVELRSEVAEATSAFLARNSIDDRFSVVCGNGLQALDGRDDRFDIVTLYNNVYYFSAEGRRQLFERIRARLSTRGCLRVASMLHGNTPASLNLSLVLGVTRECNRLPAREELVADLTAAGFSKVAQEKLIPSEPFMAFAAT